MPSVSQGDLAFHPRPADRLRPSPAPSNPNDTIKDHRTTEIYSPVPPIVTPGAQCGDAPSDAIVLFNGRNEDEWVKVSDGSPANWVVADGILTVNKSTGNIQTKRTFTNYQLHIEYRIPADITARIRPAATAAFSSLQPERAMTATNCRYWTTINNTTYVNGQAGSIYKQSIPLANPCRPPGQWQTYDVIWTAPTFNTDGSLRDSARVTVFLNGVLVQNNFVLKGANPLHRPALLQGAWRLPDQVAGTRR